MKGIELPINILVVVAIAVIVLLGMVALYFIGISPFNRSVSLDGVKNDACRQLVQTNNCGGHTWDILITNYDANKDTLVGDSTTPTPSYPTACTAAGNATGDDLATLCYCQYGRTAEAYCRQLCGCP